MSAASLRAANKTAATIAIVSARRYPRADALAAFAVMGTSLRMDAAVPQRPVCLKASGAD